MVILSWPKMRGKRNIDSNESLYHQEKGLHFDTLSLFYKERSKIMYSHQFWVLYSRSLIWTLVFVQSFLISKSLNSRNFKVKKILLRYLLVNMFSRGNDFIYLFFLRLIPNWNNAISSHATFEDVNIHSKY